MAKKKNVVKSAKGTTGALLVLMMAAGWAMTAYTVFLNTDARKQEAMISSARALTEDKLYIRAVAGFKEALKTYNTDNNLAYEEELLAIYREASMWEDYYAFIEQRISKGTAQIGEYKQLAQYYIDQESSAKAMGVLKTGMSLFQDPELNTMYESVCFEYSPVTTAYSQALMPASDWYIPTYNGEAWGYIGKNGRTILEFTYEEATRFSGNYAVVKTGGVFTLIDKQGYWNAVDKNGLDQVTALVGKRMVGVKDGKARVYTNTFVPVSEEAFDQVCLNDNGLIAVEKEGRWAILDSEMKPVTDYIFTDMAVNCRGQVFGKGYAVAADESGYFLIDEKGKPCYGQRFSNARGMEGGYYAVSDGSGRWGFADEKGQVVIDCQYEDVYSFSNHLAPVKYAGEWGYLNQSGAWAIEPEFDMAYPFYEGNSLVTDSLGNYRILSLKHYKLFN